MYALLSFSRILSFVSRSILGFVLGLACGVYVGTHGLSLSGAFASIGL